MSSDPIRSGPVNSGPANPDTLVIRKCQGLEEVAACVALQKTVWNFTDAELMPLRLFIVAEKIGGQVIGAFDGVKLVAFALSVPGTRGGHSYLHSQMLAVSAEYRNAGLGRRIKFFQREDALARGFELIEWTFDPLEIKNAYLNVEKLGAIARRYSVNQYGFTSSPLQGGLPSDRLVAEWWLKSKRVENLLPSNRSDGESASTKWGQPPSAVQPSEARFNLGGPSPSGRSDRRAQLSPRASQDDLKAISVPAEIYGWKASPGTRHLAQEVQEKNRRDFLEAFSRNLAVVRYERDQQGNGKFLLGRWDEDWMY
jgi:predicted GNAT superfamily acetyltransferase